MRPFRFGLKKDPPSSRRPAMRVRPTATHRVEVQIMGSNSLDVLHARDISVTGLGVYVPHGFEGCDIDAEVDLVITLPQSRAFLAKGVIRHVTEGDSDKGHFGVEFTQLSPGDQAQLERYIVNHPHSS